MGVKQYALGKEHGEKGLKSMHHRKNGRRYDSASAQSSYDRGYSDGAHNRRTAQQIISKDFTVPTRLSVRMVTHG